MSFSRVTTYDEAVNQLKECLIADPVLPIYLVGGGGCGKTKLTDDCLFDLQKAKRVVHRESLLRIDSLGVHEVHSLDQVCPTRSSHVIDMSLLKST